MVSYKIDGWVLYVLWIKNMKMKNVKIISEVFLYLHVYHTDLPWFQIHLWKNERGHPLANYSSNEK